MGVCNVEGGGLVALEGDRKRVVLETTVAVEAVYINNKLDVHYKH